MSSSASFVSKHFLIQRRKTIHDIVDCDPLNTTPITQQTDMLDSLFISNNLSPQQTLVSCTESRVLVKHGHVQLLNVTIMINS